MENSFDQHRERRALFTTDAELYDDGRPGYPSEVFEILENRCGPLAGTRAVEIGPGTGQATGPLLDEGVSLLAVELGPEMAARLRANNVGKPLRVIVGPFEDIDLPAERFDLVVAATSLHWVDPEVALARCGELLRPGGSLALWWNYFGDPARPDPFHEALQPVLRCHAPELIDTTSANGAGGGTGAHPYALDTRARVAEIDATGLFGPVAHEVVAWTGQHSSAEIRCMFGSFSPFLALAPERREPLLDDIEQLAEAAFGGVVSRPYLTPIYTALRRPLCE